MFDDNDHRPIRVIGTIEFEFSEHENGHWYSAIVPKIKSTVLRDIYKMALIVAVLQDTCKKKLDAIDRMIMNNKEIAEYHNMMLEEKKNKPAGLADIDRYQQPLPFGEKSNESRTD